ncbi:MAG: hypothetical protein ACO1N0_17650 [Fluviicola sp.]
MKHLLFILILLLTAFSCIHSPKKKANKQGVVYTESNELQFTFLVFDKQKVDSFFSRYEPFNPDNTHFKEDIKKLKTLKFQKGTSKESVLFNAHSETPTREDLEIAIDDLTESYYENRQDYFDVIIQYLFFYHCLPNGFQNKWPQTIEGDFKFNFTFFSLLREKSPVLDKLIYGEIGYWDKKLVPIFEEHIFNEITPENAQKIKVLIQEEKVFQDTRFKKDREKFSYLLDKAIRKEWRLILTDWN